MSDVIKETGLNRATVLPSRNATALCTFVKTLNNDKCYVENVLRGKEVPRAGGAVYLAIKEHVRVCSNILEITKKRNNRTSFSVCLFWPPKLVMTMSMHNYL